MNPFAWTVDHLNQPGFSAALLEVSDLDARCAALKYDMGKAIKVETLDCATFNPRFRGMDSATRHKEAIAESWKREEVVAARLTRDGVRCTVDGVSTDSRSLRESFRVHGLPDHKHIRFRMSLKASRAATFVWEGFEYHFELVALG
ncbi:hypothetical protein [Cupriavidus pauculus]|uniref:Uncharacterized protein n=1 Tax=Cupriavidus pauculus TaxID=82633 RepID=A0A2N5C9I8_9BURK|nr:hypothetical protein [Cupriavidus pauculus]PLP98895.1 hypothetical protein CYJ10_19090 [Cupriavidus pauculus]